jgi:hypothetical protein
MDTPQDVYGLLPAPLHTRTHRPCPTERTACSASCRSCRAGDQTARSRRSTRTPGGATATCPLAARARARRHHHASGRGRTGSAQATRSARHHRVNHPPRRARALRRRKVMPQGPTCSRGPPVQAGSPGESSAARPENCCAPASCLASCLDRAMQWAVVGGRRAVRYERFHTGSSNNCESMNV